MVSGFHGHIFCPKAPEAQTLCILSLTKNSCLVLGLRPKSSDYSATISLSQPKGIASESLLWSLLFWEFRLPWTADLGNHDQESIVMCREEFMSFIYRTSYSVINYIDAPMMLLRVFWCFMRVIPYTNSHLTFILLYNHSWMII